MLLGIVASAPHPQLRCWQAQMKDCEETTMDAHKESVFDFAERTRRGFERKSDHNKSESLFLFILVITSTLSAPLFVTLGRGLLVGKIIPSILSLCAAAATAWLQLRKPQQLWALYRTCQRRIEDEKTHYAHAIGDYEDADSPDKMLADRVAAIALDAHNEWLPLIPSPERMGQIIKTKENRI